MVPSRWARPVERNGERAPRDASCSSQVTILDFSGFLFLLLAFCVWLLHGWPR